MNRPDLSILRRPPFRLTRRGGGRRPRQLGRKPQYRRLFEPLEPRTMLAGDLLLGANALSLPYEPWSDADADSAAQPAVVLAAVQTASLGQPEGESGDLGGNSVDLVGFAQSLANAGVKLFGAAWSASCTEQKQLFQDGGRFLDFIEVANPDGSPNQIAIDQNISEYPTWEFPGGARVTGLQTLETVSQLSGVPIPHSNRPFIAPLPDVTLLSGSPLHIALDGYDPNGDPLTYTVSSSDPLVAASLLSGNQSWLLSVRSYGEMTAQFFDGQVPRVTQRIKDLTNAGFYDGLTFHRVIDGFVIQGGDPKGDGTGGSTLPDFDNQFHADLQHNASGIFSFANRGDNTNNSQFFITDLDPEADPDSQRILRRLDFNHPIFAVLTEGYEVLDALTQVPAASGTGRPLQNVIIDSAEVFTDRENAVAMLKAAEGTTGEADITVTIADEDNNQFSRTFHVTVVSDTYDGSPFLLDGPELRTTRDQSITFQLQALDVEGDTLVFTATNPTTVQYTGGINGETGEITVNPPAGFVGVLQLEVKVRQSTTADANDQYDERTLNIDVAPEAPTSLDLLSASDSGVSDDDNLTNVTVMQFVVAGVSDGAIVTLRRDNGVVIGQGTAIGTIAAVTTNDLAALGDGQFSITATQTVNGVESDPSPPLVVTIDREIPPFDSSPPAAADINVPLVYDTENPEEGSAGFTYSLVNAPSGAVIDAATGVLTWTPTAGQVGPHAFAIRARDAAGNSRTQNVNMDVTGDVLVRCRLETTDPSGTPIRSIRVGEDFLLRGFVEDPRAAAQGVYAAYLDVMYDNSLAGIVGPIDFGPTYGVARSGNTTTAGVMDEVGAAANGIAPLGPGQFLLFSVPLRAVAAGEERFLGDAPDDFPAHDILVFGQSQPIPLEQIDFGEASIEIAPPFILRDDEFGIDEDTVDHTLDVLANDEVLDGSCGALTIVAVTVPDHGGTATIAPDGQSLSYSPAANFFGAETVVYTASDGSGTDQATVTVQVYPVNDDPVANADQFTVSEDSSGNKLSVLNNDNKGPDEGDPRETLKITAVGPTSGGGIVTIDATGLFLVYTPLKNFFGDDAFAYTIRDRSSSDVGNARTSQAVVTVTVEPLNDDPSAVNDSFTVDQDSTDNVLDVLANDNSSPDGPETLTITQVGTTSNGGTVTIADGGAAVAYSPPADFVGTDTFTYTISDGNGGTDDAVVTVAVSPRNHPPTAVDDKFTVTKGLGAQTLDVLDNDSIAPDEGETLVVAAVGATAHGSSVAVAPDGQRILFTPAPDFVGTETFTYTISDGNGGTDQAIVTVDVLDYLPRCLVGAVHQGGSGRPLGGVEVALRGADIYERAVELFGRTRANGSYSFDEVAPGGYTITPAAPVFLLGGASGLAVQSEADDTDSLGNNFTLRGRQAEYMSLLDFSAPAQGPAILAAVSSSQGQLWYCLERGWDGLVEVQVVLSADLSTIQLTVIDSQSRQFVAAIPAHDARRVQWLAREGNAHLLRILGGRSDFDFQPVNGAAAAGEGQRPGGTDVAPGSGLASSLASTSPSETAVEQQQRQTDKPDEASQPQGVAVPDGGAEGELSSQTAVSSATLPRAGAQLQAPLTTSVAGGLQQSVASTPGLQTGPGPASLLDISISAPLADAVAEGEARPPRPADAWPHAIGDGAVPDCDPHMLVDGVMSDANPDLSFGTGDRLAEAVAPSDETTDYLSAVDAVMGKGLWLDDSLLVSALDPEVEALEPEVGLVK